MIIDGSRCGRVDDSGRGDGGEVRRGAVWGLGKMAHSARDTLRSRWAIQGAVGTMWLELREIGQRQS